MRITCVGSGSSGNEYLLESEGSLIVLDCGCKWKETMIACGFDVLGIEAALVTHAHG